MKKNLFCVVGLGNHAVSKIIPALEHRDFHIIGIVTKKKKKIIGCQTYKNLRLAINSVPKNTIFILCSPPSLHFMQAKEILKHKFNLIIEKPIFLYSKELDKIIKNLPNQKIFLAESLMYNFSKQYKEFKKIWRENKNKVKKLKIIFTIPSFPKESFRNKNNSFPVSLYDIGCYPIYLINELKLDVQIKKFRIKNFGDIKRELFFLDFIDKGLKVEIKFGVDKFYKNSVSLELVDNAAYFFSPFFYGRSGKRTIRYVKDGKTDVKTLDEENAFQKLFKQQPNVWLKSQAKRNKSMRKNLTDLEYIWKMYKNYNV